MRRWSLVLLLSVGVASGCAPKGGARVVEATVIEAPWIPVLSHDIVSLIEQSVPKDIPLALLSQTALSQNLEEVLRSSGYALSARSEGANVISYAIDDVDSALLVMRVTVSPWLDGGRLYEKSSKGLEPISLLSAGMTEDGLPETDALSLGPESRP